MKLSKYTIDLLEDIEKRIDPETEEDYYSQWLGFWEDRCTDKVFLPKRKKVTGSGVELKDININDALGDMDLMLALELTTLSRRLSNRTSTLGIRANYGTGIMTSLFGAEIFEMPRSTNTLPTTKSFGDTDEVAARIENGVPDLLGGWGRKVFEFGELCAELLEKYPKIKRYVSVYHPDTQGPLDVAELLWGQEMFYAMYDEPELVHKVLRCITDTYKAFLNKWYEIIPMGEDPLSVHWSTMHKGTIMLRLDSAMNISRDFYEEFSKPYDKELLDYYGGGCMHFCGRGDHYIDSLCELDNMYSFNMSQPHLNDMSKILKSAEENNKKIIILPDAEKYADEFNVRCGLLNAKG